MITKISFPTRRLDQLVTFFSKSYLPGNALDSLPPMGLCLHLLMTIHCYNSPCVPRQPAVSILCLCSSISFEQS